MSRQCEPTRNGVCGRPAAGIEQRRICQDPVVQGGMVHRQAALPEQLLDVSVAERVAQIPRNGLQDHRRLEVAVLEVVLGPTLQMLDKGAQDYGSLRTGATKSAAMPVEPAMLEICDTPP